MNKKPIICKQGFHACEAPMDCLKYYPDTAVICEVQILGAVDISTDRDKIATNKIKIVRQLSTAEKNKLLTGTTGDGTIHNPKRTYTNGKSHSIDDRPSFDNGTQFEWNENGIMHRDGDKPAFVVRNGCAMWYKNGKSYYPPVEVVTKYCDSNGTINLSAVMNGHKE
jgi:hypothetical protein